MSKVKLVRGFTGYTYIEGHCGDVAKVLTHLKDVYGRDTSDVNDALRILSNFNSFYDMMRRKFKDFISPKKDEGDLIKGLVVVDKIKLFKIGNVSYVQLIFDKRVGLELISNILKDLGIDFEVTYE
ncbi:MAG: hypothetical protein RMH77_06600 [Sulfolobales archaeon]|nr:hypothetical protein [Sulfolobales archaeon]MCX8185744.1 hypothetical protein [Sulfolobales archaeon]MDW7970048.1 hypothetical protein [Sulfolobales archaeon]